MIITCIYIAYIFNLYLQMCLLLLFDERNALPGTSISPTKALLKMIFQRWEMLVFWRVSVKSPHQSKIDNCISGYERRQPKKCVRFHHTEIRPKKTNQR